MMLFSLDVQMGDLGKLKKCLVYRTVHQKFFINIGGKFKIGSGFFGKLLLEKVEEIINPFLVLEKRA